MPDIRVSVVMAVYNSEKYLSEALDSLIGQSLKNIELILVDDGSEDASLDILNEYAIKDGRISVLQNKEKADGAAMARNLGVSRAKGEYLSIVDADDFFEPDMLEKAYNKACSENADVVIFDAYRFDDTNKADLCRNNILFRDRLPDGYESKAFSPEDNVDELFRMTLGAAWNTLISAELVKKHDLMFMPFHHADDFEFVYMAFALADRIAVIPERLMHYRVNHAMTQASRVSEWPDTAWEAMLSFKKRLYEAGLYRKYKTAFIRAAMSYQLFYLNAMKNDESFVRLYKKLKEEKLSELDIADAAESELKDEELIRQRDLILNEEPEGYLFKKLHNLPPFDGAVSWKDSVPKGSRIIVYGADRLGVDVVHSILWYQDYKLVSWVDDQYDILGYPVLSPETVLNKEYDLILIVSGSSEVFRKRSSELINKGIDPGRIKWQGR